MVDLTPHQIVQTLSQIGRELDEKAAEVERLDAQFVEAKVTYKSDYAKAFLTATGSNDVRRYTADEATAQLLLDMETAEQVLRAAKEALRVLRDRLEIGRSLGAVMRMEWANG